MTISLTSAELSMTLESQTQYKLFDFRFLLIAA